MKDRHRKKLIELIERADQARRDWENLAVRAYKIHPKQIFSPREANFIRFIQSDDFILDLGCGNAKTLKALAEKCRGGIGIESSPVCHKDSKRFNSSKIRIIEDNFFNVLPGLAGQYTVTLMSHVLEHVIEPIPLLQQLTSEKLLLLVPTNTWEFKMRDDLGIHSTRQPDHYREYDKDLLTSELQASGWQSEYMEYTEEEELLCFARRVR